MNSAVVFGPSLWSGYALPACPPRKRHTTTATGRGSTYQARKPVQTKPATSRYRRLAVAALKPLLHPTEAMITAAHEAVWFDAFWAINSRADFKKAVRAMMASAIKQSDP